jgi:hypothetical protein
LLYRNDKINNSLKNFREHLIMPSRSNSMKILKYSIILLAFAGFVFMGCSDKYQDPVTPNTSDEKTAPSLYKTTGPGAWIIEYDANHAYAFLDEESGLILTLGIKDPSEFCSGTLNFDLFSFKDLLLPNSDPDLRRLIRKITGKDISAYVWQFESVPANLIEFTCTNQPIAGGTAKFVSTDNDYYVGEGGNNRDSFGSKANGTLTGTDGSTYKLNLVYHALVDKEEITLFKEVLTIHLTQTGKK